MSAHTPGPWSVSWDCNGLAHVGMGPNCTVSRVMAPPAGDQEANARLIAAAPELLEALRHLLHNIEATGKRIDLGFAPRAAREAIAKATGANE
jgi:hypothetical protein